MHTSVLSSCGPGLNPNDTIYAFSKASDAIYLIDSYFASLNCENMMETK